MNLLVAGALAVAESAVLCENLILKGFRFLTGCLGYLGTSRPRPPFYCAKELRTGGTSSAAVAFSRRACRKPSANFHVPSKFGYSVHTLWPHTCLIFPFVRSGNPAQKTVLPAGKLKRLQQKGKIKNSNQKRWQTWKQIQKKEG